MWRVAVPGGRRPAAPLAIPFEAFRDALLEVSAAIIAAHLPGRIRNARRTSLIDSATSVESVVELGFRGAKPVAPAATLATRSEPTAECYGECAVNCDWSFRLMPVASNVLDQHPIGLSACN